MIEYSFDASYYQEAAYALKQNNIIHIIGLIRADWPFSRDGLIIRVESDNVSYVKSVAISGRLVALCGPEACSMAS